MDQNSIDKSGPAFPVASANAGGYCGMTLRDYFAAKAMQGFAADPECSWPDGVDGMARTSYQWSDAMLKARSA